eukprot:jgi/Tetstr1/432449/TSEL_021825.t1
MSADRSPGYIITQSWTKSTLPTPMGSPSRNPTGKDDGGARSGGDPGGILVAVVGHVKVVGRQGLGR